MVEPEEMSFARQRLGKQVSESKDTQVTIEELWERCFLFGTCKVIINKISVENRQSSFRVPSEQLV
jgi:hypothetical protein